MVVCFVSVDSFITHACQFNDLITAKRDSISNTKYLTTSFFFVFRIDLIENIRPVWGNVNIHIIQFTR